MSATPEQAELAQAIAALEAQRALLGDAVVEIALAPLQEKLAALARAEAEPALQGERKTVSIVLADVKGSTDLAEQLNIEDWVETMNRVFRILEAEVFRFGGLVNQFRGDGLLAFFGTVAAHENDPERAVRAAIAMQEALGPLTEELQTREGVTLQLRIGVNTGEVIITQVGDSRHYTENTAMGRAVALAARMETAAEPGTVLVSDSTYRLTSAYFEWQPLGQIMVKGISQPIAVYRPLNPRAVPGKARGIPGLAAPLTGRRDELARLHETLARLRKGHGGILTLVGEAGLGKSRLIAELRASADDAAIAWIEGHCLSYGITDAYGLWVEVLRSLLGVTAETNPVTVQDALWERGQQLCPKGFEAIYPHLRALMVAQQQPRPQGQKLEAGDDENRKQHTFAAISALLTCAARQRPLLIICEDLHWADPTSLELLEALFPLTAALPLLLLCVLRPETTHGCWRLREQAIRRYPAQHTDILLAPLNADDSAALLSRLLHMEVLPALLKQRILERAEGNPFYVEEITRSLLDSGSVAFDEARGQWYAAQEITDIAVPETLQGVLIARIDRLRPEAKRLLQLGAVTGRTFSKQVLAAILPPDEDLDRSLEQLQQTGLLYAQPQGPETLYTFKHTLTREAAYNSLLHRDRRVFHRQVAEALKALYPHRMEEMHGILAQHWDQADEPNRAIPHMLQAGDQAMRQFANAEACAYFERALALARQTGLTLAEADILYKLGNTHRRQGNYSEARAYLEQTLAIFRQFGNRRREGIVLGELGAIARNLGDYTKARAYFEENLEISRAVHNWRGESITLNNLGQLLLEQGAHTEALEHFEQALRINRGMRDSWGEGIGLGNFGYAYLLLGDYGLANTHFKQALHISRGVRNLRGEGKILVNVSLWHTHQGELEPAYACGQQALAIAHETAHRSDQGYALTAVGRALIELERFDEAAEAYAEALKIRQRIGERQRLAEPQAGLAEVALRQGHAAEAQNAIEPVLQQLEANPTLCGTATPLPVLLVCYEVLRANGDYRAGSLLTHAYMLLQAQAQALPDPALRRTFLEAVAAHRAIAETYTQTQREDSSG